MRLRIFLTLPILGTILFPSAALAMAPPPNSGKIQLYVRDVITHYAVPAKLLLEGSQSLSQQTDQNGNLILDLAPGEYKMQISAEGYEQARTHTYITAGHDIGMTISMEPLAPPPEEAPDAHNAKIRPGNTLIEGYIVDVETGKPLPGVELHLTNASVTTHTDARGYYSLSIPTPSEQATGETGYDTLTYRLPGYKTIVRKDVPIFGDSRGLTLDMQRGSGVWIHDDMPHIQREARGDYVPKAQTSTPPRKHGTLKFYVRDVTSLHLIGAVVNGHGPTSFTTHTDAAGHGSIEVSPGSYAIEISASGYQPMQLSMSVEDGGVFGDDWSISLTLLAPPPEETPSAIESLIQPDHTLLHSYVADANTGMPISDAEVEALHAGVSTRTDASGHFALSIPTPEAESGPGGMGTDTIIISKPGYQTLRMEHFALVTEEMGPGVAKELKRGVGVQTVDVTHPLDNHTAGTEAGRPE